ncbi:MAG: DNA alkylation repair protein, partial [bacterium]|nr:DNA alkylation repair protein [bacterium]
MKQNEIVASIRKELKKQVDIKYRDGERRLFKEPIKNIGVRLPNRRKVAQKLWPQAEILTKIQLFKVCEELLGGLSEEVTIGLDWLWRSRNKLEAKDFKLFEKWVNLYLDNWAKIDDFSTHALGYLINRFPQLASEVFSWTKSKNRWVKRAAAV